MPNRFVSSFAVLLSKYEGSAMSKAHLIALTKKWNAKGGKADGSSVKKVEVLDVMDQTAIAKVTAVWGIDYMQLAKFDGNWQILHILWQSHPMKKLAVGPGWSGTPLESPILSIVA